MAFTVLSVVHVNLELVRFGGYLSHAPETPQEEIALLVPDALIYAGADLYRGAFLACALLYGVWFYRAVQNAVMLRAQVAAPVMELGNYAIPIVNLFAPFQTMKEIVLRSGSQLNLDPAALRLLRCWWGCWCAGNVLNPMVRFIDRAPATAGNGVLSAAVGALAWIAFGAAAWFIREVILEVTRRQERARVDGTQS